MIDMLDGVKPVTAALERIDQPFSPFQHLFADNRMTVIDVGEHQVIVVPEFTVYVLVPVLILSDNLVDSGSSFPGVVIGAVKMLEIPLESGVRIASSGEGELGPAFDFKRLRDDLKPVVPIDLDYLEDLCLVGSGLMIHHQIDVHGDSLPLTFDDGVDQFLLGPIFGPYSALLVELAQIIQIVDAVPGLFHRQRLGHRRHPYRIDSGAFQLGRELRQPLPVLAVGGHMPFEELHHCMIPIHHELPPASY
ncbi:hypothetical protein D3C71_1447550 [compost metagenome]